MSRIKTRESVKDIKVIDKAAVASERMKTALVRSKDQFENLMDDGQVTPSEYAEDKIRYAAEDVADRVGHDVSSEAKKAVNKGKEAYRKHREEKRIEKNEERVNRYEERFRREEQARSVRTSSQESHSHQSATRASFIPFLIDHYEHIYWIDYRSYDNYCSYAGISDSSISALVRSKSINDVIVLNNINSTGSGDFLDYMEKLYK